MKTKLLLLLFWVTTVFYAQSKLTSTTLKNSYKVHFEQPQNEQIVISIIDSENNTLANLITADEDTPISSINNRIFKLIASLSKGYYYKIPNFEKAIKVNVEIEKMTKNDFLTEIKKLETIKIIEILNTLLKEKYDEIKKLKVDEVINITNKSNLNYKIKKINDKEFMLLNLDKEIKKIDVENENSFYENLYAVIKDDASLIELFLDDDTFKSLKETDLMTDENAIELEKSYHKMKGMEKVADYNYLGYIGTNFDLVEGIKAKNVFFAINVLSKPKKDKDKVGFYVSLYGNRTLSINDSIKNIEHLYRVFDSIVDNQSQKYLQKQTYNYSKSTNVDNLGAYFSPLFKLWGLSSIENSTQLYLSPSLEFIWRRVSVNNSISNVTNQSPFLIPGNSINYTTPINRSAKSYQFNRYDFHLGGGFWVFHENKKISVRLNMNLGWSRSFTPNIENALNTESDELTIKYNKIGDVFYTGKLWITEASTGVTLQAEILNTLITPQPFYGVTLSKAFDFEKLGAFFKPIVSR